MNYNWILGFLFACLASSCTKEYYQTSKETDRYEILLTDYGIVGDGKRDCSALINKLIEDMPASGGVIVIPEGDFVLDKPIVINRNYVTIRGVNPGMRSNIDVKGVDSLLGPGGGSKLVLRRAPYAIHLAPVSDVGGARNRISGVEIKDLLISGGTANNGTGIYVEHDNDRCRISNVIGINLSLGIRVNAADAMVIQDCWICEVKNSIEMSNGIQNMITNCQLGAQPAGVTCKLTNENNLIFTNNHVYPDGSSNLVLENCSQVNISNNNFKSYYTGMLDLKGDGNLISGNLFWLDGALAHQLLQRGEEYGVIRVNGTSNFFTSNTVRCLWHGSATNPVTIRSLKGKNRFSDIWIENQSGSRVLFVNQEDEVWQVVAEEHIVREETRSFTGKAAYLIPYATAEQIEDDDERASHQWFARAFPEGDVLTPALLKGDLSQYTVIVLHIDRTGMERGWESLPAELLAGDALTALTEYYKNGGNLLLLNHATQLLIPLGRLSADRAPGIYGAGGGGVNGDMWGAQAHIGLHYDHRTHPLYRNLTASNAYGHEVYPLIGAGHKEDHNCMWDLNAYGFPTLYPDAGNVVTAFEKENHAVVLGTWQHVTDYCCAGILELLPMADYKGNCIAIGLAAYEWNQNSGRNSHQSNVEQMTRNAIEYLGNPR